MVMFRGEFSIVVSNWGEPNWFWLDDALSQSEHDWESASQSQRGFEASVWNPVWAIVTVRTRNDPYSMGHTF